MATEAERVVVELLARVDGFDGKVKQSAAAFGGAMGKIESSADKAEKVVAKAAQKKAEAEERAAIRIAEAAEKARIRTEAAAQQASLRAEQFSVKAAIAAERAAERKAAAEAAFSLKAQAAAERAARASEAAASRAALAAEKAAQRKAASAEAAAKREAIAAERAAAQEIAARNRTELAAGRSFRNVQQQSRNLGFQIADVGTQLSAGTSPFLILAQQGPQVANALDGAKGKVGQFASFLSGPFGAAALVATSLLGIFIGKLLQTGDSIDDLVEKLQKEAKEAEKADRANELFGETIEGVTKALRENREVLDKLAGAQDSAGEAALRTAATQAELAAKVANTTVKLLEQAKAQEEINNSISVLDFENPEVASQARARTLTRQIDLEKQLTKARAGLAEALQQITDARSLVSVEAGNLSAEDKVTKLAEQRVEAARRRAIAEGKVGVELQRQVASINEARDAELKRIRDAASEKRKNKDVGDATNFISPVAGGRITGSFGERRPGRNHAGLDIAVPVGTPVKAPAGGVVIEAGTVPGYGNVVYIDHGRGTISRLAHLSQIKATKGQIVSQGDLVGLSGGAKGAPGSGNSKGPHLHQEVRVGGRPVDPRKGPFNTDPAAVFETVERLEEEELRRRQAFQNELASLQDQEIDARQALINSAEEIAKLELEAIELSRKKYADNVKANVEIGKLTAAEAIELAAINEERAKLRTELVQRREDERRFHMAEEAARRSVDFNLGQIDVQEELLQSQIQVADTIKERRDLERRLIDLQYQEERIQLEAIIAETERLRLKKDLTEAEQRELERANDRAKLAEERLGTMGERQGNDRQRSSENNAGPLQAYLDEIPDTAGEINEALESVAAGGLATFTDALTDAIVNFRSLGDVGRAVLQNLTAALVKMAIQQLILHTVGKALSKASIAGVSAEAATVAAAWAPAAALASLATLGSNAGPAAAALAGTTALSLGLAATGAVAKKDGGPIFGPGGPRDDRVLMAASPGEYVIQARSAAKLGRGALDFINSRGELPGFRNGGPVRSVAPINGKAAARGGSGADLSEASLRRLEDAVERGAAAQAPVQLFPTMSPERAMDAMLSNPGAQRKLFDFMSNNSGSINSNLRR